jgi:hypothetical protein
VNRLSLDDLAGKLAAFLTPELGDEAAGRVIVRISQGEKGPGRALVHLDLAVRERRTEEGERVMNPTRLRRFLSVSAAAFVAIVATLTPGLTSSASARITRIVIDSVQSPTFAGTSFGVVGQYERIVGQAFGEVDPHHPLNAIITDI